MAIDAQLFRSVVGNFPTGVTVVTAWDGSVTRRGLTINAFCSVSLDPPLVLICVDRGSETLPAIESSQRFAVNVLAEGHGELALDFASKGGDKFEGVGSHDDESHGGPMLEDHSCAFLSCRVVSTLEAGDHWIIVGEVESGKMWSDREPLVYMRGRFVPPQPELSSPE